MMIYCKLYIYIKFWIWSSAAWQTQNLIAIKILTPRLIVLLSRVTSAVFMSGNWEEKSQWLFRQYFLQ